MLYSNRDLYSMGGWTNGMGELRSRFDRLFVAQASNAGVGEQSVDDYNYQTELVKLYDRWAGVNKGTLIPFFQSLMLFQIYCSFYFGHKLLVASLLLASIFSLVQLLLIQPLQGKYSTDYVARGLI